MDGLQFPHKVFQFAKGHQSSTLCQVAVQVEGVINSMTSTSRYAIATCSGILIHIINVQINK